MTTSAVTGAHDVRMPDAGGRRQARVRALLPGLLLCVAVAAVATGLGREVPVIGGPVLAIVIGIVLSTLVPWARNESLTPGLVFASRPVLQTSIVVLGTGLSLQEVLRVGGASLPVMFGSLAVSLIGAQLIGRALGVSRDVRTLIGVGTGICGASAIAASTAVMKPRDSDVAYAIGTIFTFNIAAVLLFPPLGHLIGMSGHSFGLWSGTAVNDMSSVVAAAYSFGDGAGPYAIVVKLTRSLMIIPIVVVLAWATSRRTGVGVAERGALPWRKVVPAFLVGFVIAAALDTVGVIPHSWHGGLSQLGTFLITVALAGIGLSMRLRQLRQAGLRPLVLGGILWICVAGTSLGLQLVTGTI
ncbi:YeiH family protein [Rudaeicoccus suwonensis]|uniref:Putative integral membrane protein (TIGR00698 family) n=1 Tax=Rudaeicoccus suwonensis TaxID=657409 RepID=A0A561E9S4_9MICO|nr:putative sulfate exporter family transporter [Rudaeicoccus suwonensis]TWE12351.1 putative integral membrane protein (TIGR00698 family) [Rudaeicoccus suwonensis]